jgi:hypothetical protein
MFRFSIRELLLITAVVALVAGWWLEHRRQAQANALLEWKNRVLEVSLSGKGYEIKTEGKSITLTSEGETMTFTPTSFASNNGKGTIVSADFSKSKRPNGEPMPEYHYPPLPSLFALACWAAGGPVGQHNPVGQSLYVGQKCQLPHKSCKLRVCAGLLPACSSDFLPERDCPCRQNND